MPNNLRTIVRKHQEEQTLRNYLGLNYDTTSEEEKRRFIQAVSSTVDREVDGILKIFLEEIQETTSNSNTRRMAILVMIITVISTAGIGYGVNLENWVMVGLFGLAMIVIQVFNIYND